jgi:hypothetical protein
VFPEHGTQRWADGCIAELERKIGQQMRAEALRLDYHQAGNLRQIGLLQVVSTRR